MTACVQKEDIRSIYKNAYIYVTHNYNQKQNEKQA